MRLELDPIHVVGYLGALGSLVFGTNQLRILLAKQEAKDVSIFDYSMRVAYSVLLGVYSVGISNPIFIAVNFGAAILSALVAVAAIRIKREKRSDHARKAAAVRHGRRATGHR